MKKVLLTTPYGPYDVAWGEDMLDLMSSRLARGHGVTPMRSSLPTWGLYLIAENLESSATVLEYPKWDDFFRELDKGYDVVGIQLKTINNERTARMIEAIRDRSPNTEIVIGGYGVSALDDVLPGDTHGFAQYIKENADHLCRDEGVRYMRQLLGENTDRPITQFEMPYARYHLPGMRSFDLKIPAVLVALGCPSACDFCNTSAFYRHKKIYIAEPEQTVAFIRGHVERLGAETLNVVLFDEDIFLNPEYVRELGRLLRKDRKLWGVRWISFGSVRSLSQYDVEEIRECGCGGVWIGVESGMCEQERSKTGYAKREGSREPPELFDDLRRHGIETIGSMILGLDFHTPQNIKDDIDYFVKLKPTFYQVSPLTPCPGTKLYRDLQQSGRLFDSYDHTSFHLWKDDVFQHDNFAPGEIKQYYDLAHEKLRTENGPPVMQFTEASLLAYETLKDSKSEYLRHQAKLAKDMAMGALPIIRTIANHPASPKVLARARGLEAQASRLFGPESLKQRLLGKAIELAAHLGAERLDPLERPTVVSDPETRITDYNLPDHHEPRTRSVEAERRRSKRRERTLPQQSVGPLRSASTPRRRVAETKGRLRVIQETTTEVVFVEHTHERARAREPNE